jgi:hypothetical protein
LPRSDRTASRLALRGGSGGFFFCEEVERLRRSNVSINFFFSKPYSFQFQKQIISLKSIQIQLQDTLISNSIFDHLIPYNVFPFFSNKANVALTFRQWFLSRFLPFTPSG